VGAIVGGVIGGLAAVALIAGGIIYYKRTKAPPTNYPLETAKPSLQPVPSIVIHQPSQDLERTKSIAPSNVSSDITLSSVNLKSLWVGKPCEAILTRVPEQDDEMMVNSGDSILLSEVFEDGWGRGVNDATKQSGMVPLAALMRLQ
jgi:hypothetical protein